MCPNKKARRMQKSHMKSHMKSHIPCPMTYGLQEPFSVVFDDVHSYLVPFSFALSFSPLDSMVCDTADRPSLVDVSQPQHGAVLVRRILDPNRRICISPTPGIPRQNSSGLSNLWARVPSLLPPSPIRRPHAEEPTCFSYDLSCIL